MLLVGPMPVMATCCAAHRDNGQAHLLSVADDWAFLVDSRESPRSACQLTILCGLLCPPLKLQNMAIPRVRQSLSNGELFSAVTEPDAAAPEIPATLGTRSFVSPCSLFHPVGSSGAGINILDMLVALLSPPTVTDGFHTPGTMVSQARTTPTGS